MSVSFEAAAAIAALSSACALAGGWWGRAFWRGVPLERKVRALDAEIADLGSFASEIIDVSNEAVVRHPTRAVEEAAGRALGALHRRRPELTLAAFARRQDGSAALLAHRGGPWSRLELSTFRFDQGMLARAAESGRSSWTLENAKNDPLETALLAQGYQAAAAGGWTDEQGAGVVLALLSGADEGLELLTPRLELAASVLRSTAAAA